MDGPAFDRDFWEGRWSEVLRQNPDQVAERPPNVHLTAAAADLRPGSALDAGCGHGAETLWLAGHGWRVTAVDFAPAALHHGESTAAALGQDIAERIEWVEGDLGVWAPPAGRFDLVISLHVHVAASVGEMVSRLASGVAPGGTLLLVGHLPIDPTTGAETAAAGQVQVTVEAATAVLDSEQWETVVAEERKRVSGPSGFDAIVCARRRS
jgi:SAM-dependent methyltransferase